MSQVMHRASSRRLRWASIILGLTVLAWLSFEDSQITGVLLLASGLACLLTLGPVFRMSRIQKGWQDRPRQTTLLLGLLAGLLVTLCALGLMALKNGLHGHDTPEYSSLQLISVVYLTPVWMAAGLLTALGWIVAKQS